MLLWLRRVLSALVANAGLAVAFSAAQTVSGTVTIVNEASVSIRHSTENGPPMSDADLARITKSSAAADCGSCS